MKHKHSRRSGLTTSLSLSLAVTMSVSCGTSKDSKTEATEEPKTTTTTETKTDPSTSSDTAILNTLAAAVPGNLALTAFSTSTSTTLALQDDASAVSGKPPEKEIKENLKILSGKADNCLSDNFKKAFEATTEETCYEFDSDMIATSTTRPGVTAAKLTGPKKGLNSKGEACLVSFARSQIVKIKDPLTKSQNILNAALCQATKEEKAKALAAGKAESTVDLIPAKVGDSLDLAPALKAAFAKGARTKEVVTSIKMTRLADVSDQKVYQTVFTLVDEQSNTRLFTLNHSPKDKTNEEYNGILYFAVKPPKGKADPMAGPNGSADMVFYVSISYVRSKNTDATYSMNYEARVGRFTKEIDPIQSTGQLDYNANADFTVDTKSPKYGAYKKADGTYYTADNQAAGSFSTVSVANTETAEGKLTKQLISFWINPGSSYLESARGMVFSAAPNSSGVMEGCAASGAASIDMTSGISIRRTIKERDTDKAVTLEPRGFYHPFVNTASNNFGGTVTTLDGSSGYKYRRARENMNTDWALLADTSADAVTFVTQPVGALMTSQCFTQDATSGLYVIDTAKTKGVDGFDVVKTSDTAKFIAPPTPPKPKLGDAKGDFKPAEITKAAGT